MHHRMKLKFIGTHITADEHTALRVAAAQCEMSSSALLKRLLLDFLSKHNRKNAQPTK